MAVQKQAKQLLSVQKGANATFDLNVKSLTGASLLHGAVAFCNRRVVRWLLSQGCNVNAQDYKGITPLMMAAMSGQKQITLDLLEAGADINLVNVQNESVLQMVFTQHRILDVPEQLFREFRSKTSSSEDKAKRLMALGCHLYQAAYFGDHRILEIMLDAGYPVDSMHPETKQTALHKAVMLSDTDSFKVLLRYGANIEALDKDGKSPLYFNVGNNRTYNREILKILLERGVSMTSSAARNGMFQISSILILGDGHAVQMLLDKNISFTAKEIPDGRTVLHYLAVNIDPGIVNTLKCHTQAYDVDILDSNQTTPLFYAVKNGNVYMAEFLLDKGARIDGGMCKDDYPPLYYAITRSESYFENARCVELLLQHNADPQFVYNSESIKLSMIDVAFATNNLKIIHPIIAHLALIEKLGTFITGHTNAKIDSNSSYREYFNECQRILTTKISGTITVFKLLTGNNKKLAMYLNRRKLDMKLRRIGNKQNIRSTYSYYYTTLRKRIHQGIIHKSYRDIAANILSRIFIHQIDRTHLIIHKIIDYLNDQDICHLSKV